MPVSLPFQGGQPPPLEPLPCSPTDDNIHHIPNHRQTTRSQTAAKIHDVLNTNHHTEPSVQPAHSTKININPTNSINIIAPNKDTIASNTNTIEPTSTPIYYRNQYSNSD